MKIAFCTCVQLGLSSIESIINMGGKFSLLITLHDDRAKKKSGRIYLDEIAKRNNIPLLKINHINDNVTISTLKELDIDWLFIIGWSQIASTEVLRSVKKGVIGAHPTLLPEGRGRAAIPWAILKGLTKTGVTFFKMDEGVDTGEILDQYEIELSACITATELYEKVNNAHIILIKRIWPSVYNNTIIGKKQNELNATYLEGRRPEDGELNLNMTVNEADKLIRATTKPYPGAFLFLNGAKLVIWKGSFNKQDDAISLNFVDGVYYVTEYEWIEF